jgi:hypothetical protein
LIVERTEVTKDKEERFLTLLKSSENDGNIASIYVAKDEENLREALSKTTNDALIQEAAFALMKRWFPNRLPVGEDYKKWIEISLEDAGAVIKHFVDSGIIVGEVEDDSY